MLERGPEPDDRNAITSVSFSFDDSDIGSGRHRGTDEWTPGTLGGRYDVGRLLGSGGTARVFSAYDRLLGREVAVKVFDRGAVAIEQRRRLREVSILGSIDHPGVVALHDSGTEGDRTYLVMQLVDGENLAERLLSGPLPQDQVTTMAIRLAEAVAHMHERGVTHRDLKPANVLLGADGPVIADFGVAHALDLTQITATGTVPGTAAYMAPEQVLGELTGPPADVYALGLVLLECLTAEREYPGTMAESALARLNRPPRIPGHVPAELSHVIERMTAREPKERPTAAAVTHYLIRPTVPRPDPSAGYRPAGRRRRGTMAAALSAGIVGVAAVVLPLLLAGPDAPDSMPVRPPQSIAPTMPSSAPPGSGSVGTAARTTASNPATTRPEPSATRVIATNGAPDKRKNSGKGKHQDGVGSG